MASTPQVCKRATSVQACLGSTVPEWFQEPLEMGVLKTRFTRRAEVGEFHGSPPVDQVVDILLRLLEGLAGENR